MRPSIPRCCNGDEYDSMFTPKQAMGTAARFRRRGLRGSALDVVTGIGAVANHGASVLEVGGGVGQIHIALLENGMAATAINVELSSGWEGAAAGLLAERGLEGRVRRITGDFVAQADTLPQADVVVLHRVICCYPDWKAMLEAAVATAIRVIALTFPTDRWWTRLGIGTGNLMCRIRGRSFRGYVHRSEPMMSLIRSAGFAVDHDLPGRLWHTVIASRVAGFDPVPGPDAGAEGPWSLQPPFVVPPDSTQGGVRRPGESDDRVWPGHTPPRSEDGSAGVAG